MAVFFILEENQADQVWQSCYSAEESNETSHLSVHKVKNWMAENYD
jgi:hypothetical protein